MTNRVQSRPTCATEGCGRFMQARWPHPTCPHCRGEVIAAKPTKISRTSLRTDTRSARVTYATSTSTVAASAAVTLPLEPWEVRA